MAPRRSYVLCSRRNSLLEASASELARCISRFARVEDGLVGKWLSNLAGDRLYCRKSSSALILANWHFEEANRGQGKATRVLDLLERDAISGGLNQVMFIEDVRNERFNAFLTRRPGWSSCASEPTSTIDGGIVRYAYHNQHSGSSCVYTYGRPWRAHRTSAMVTRTGLMYHDLRCDNHIILFSGLTPGVVTRTPHFRSSSRQTISRASV